MLSPGHEHVQDHTIIGAILVKEQAVKQTVKLYKNTTNSDLMSAAASELASFPYSDPLTLVLGGVVYSSAGWHCAKSCQLGRWWCSS